MKALIILFSLVHFVYASVAFVSAYKGNAQIIRDKKTIDIEIGIKLEKTDKIKTYEKTKLQLIFNDNTRITIGKNSSFEIEQYLYDEKNPSKIKARFRFSKGLFRTISGKIAKLNKERFKIKVKSATIGIRGTEFDVFVTALKTKVSVHKGAIYFTDNDLITNVKVNEIMIYEPLSNKMEVKEGVIEESVELEINQDDKKSNIKETEEKEETEETEKTEKTEETEETETSEKKESIYSDKIYEKSEKTEEKLEEVEEIVNQSITSTEVLDESINNIVESNQNNIGPSLGQSNPETTLPSNTTINNIDSSFIKVVSDTSSKDIPFLEYGYWENPSLNNKKVDTFISGTTTIEQVILNNINQNSNTASYNGGLSSIITNVDGSTLNSDGNIELNIDFSSQNLSGKISVDEGNWVANINSGSVVSSSFSSSDINSHSTSNINNISGDLQGNYYGTQGTSVGGTFNLSSTNNGSVKGVFGAKQ